MWINLSWLILSGLKNNDIELYKKIKENCINKINEIGFFEYFDSMDVKNLPVLKHDS